MKKFRLHIALFLIVLAAVIGFASFETGSSRGQSKDSKAESGVKPTILISDRQPDRAAENSSFSAASERNAVLMNELTWTFGGKQQRGWYLYKGCRLKGLCRGTRGLAANDRVTREWNSRRKYPDGNNFRVAAKPSKGPDSCAT